VKKQASSTITNTPPTNTNQVGTITTSQTSNKKETNDLKISSTDNESSSVSTYAMIAFGLAIVATGTFLFMRKK